ncbi:uncharacterized protein LOC134543038 [Bacillus rossius redtenbacheri]|uniref:uncharacterized protein LOC134543038 n=1 Tax=Bacillus rossius redtenbacheri TaxID=93214 RepID=UPI002FDDB0D9
MNRTVKDLNENQQMLADQLVKLTDEINRINSNVTDALSHHNLRIRVNEHLTLLNQEIETLSFQCESILNSIINAFKGILNPHIITPQKIVEYFNAFQFTHSPEFNLPLPEGTIKDSSLLNLIELEVFSKRNILCYLIRLPVTDHLIFDIYRIIPLPVKMKTATNKYVFIDPETDYIMMEHSKQYYAKISKYELSKCKVITKTLRVYRQTFPLINTYAREDCAPKLLYTTGPIPSNCVKKIVELKQTLWIQLEYNEWIYIAPDKEKITIVCDQTGPFDATVEDTGKLKFISACKGYGTNIFISSQLELTTNTSTKDVIPKINLDIDCCDETNYKVTLEKLKTKLHLKSTITRLDDLKIAGHKIEEVEHMINEEEWKIKHTNVISRVSVMSYIIIISLSCILCIYCCIKCGCCKTVVGNCYKKCKDGDCCNCKTICFKPTIVNIYRPRESNELVHSVNESQLEERIELRGNSLRRTQTSR